MKKYLFFILLLNTIYGSGSDSTEVNWPEKADTLIKDMEFTHIPIDAVIHAIGNKYRLNIFYESKKNPQVTFRLTDISVKDALIFISDHYSLNISIKNNIIKIVDPPKVRKIKKTKKEQKLNIEIQNNLVRADLKDVSIKKVIQYFAEKTQTPIILPSDIEDQKISISLNNVELQKALNIVLKSNDLLLSQQDDMFVVQRTYRQIDKNGKRKGGFYVNLIDSLITIEAINTPLDILLHEVAAQIGINLVFLNNISGTRSLNVTNIPSKTILYILLKGTDFSVRRENDLYYIGGKAQLDLNISKLISLKHLKADDLIPLLPTQLTRHVDIKLVKEHNGLIVLGTEDRLIELDKYVSEIDKPTAQVLLDIVVIDYDQSKSNEFSVEGGIGLVTTAASEIKYSPSLEIKTTKENINAAIDPGTGLLSYIGKLPNNFYLNLRALEEKGVANILSQPKLATLNGHKATMSIGVTEYFKLKTDQLVPGGVSNVVVSTEKFDKISAEMKLNITPWVNASGEVTVEIEQVFQTPGSRLSQEIPPAISYRTIQSTVRLRDGETIILGGLIESKDQTIIAQVPLLGSIPILGKIFQSSSNVKENRQLVIYVTPHLYYGDEGSVTIDNELYNYKDSRVD